MAVALGLSPRELEAIADSDPLLFETLHTASLEKWGATEELLAGIYELAHAQYRATLSLGGVKPGDMPEPIRVPRPGDRHKKQERKTATGSELRSWITKRNGV